MTREQVKELLPIIQAYAEGKVIEQRCAESWIEVDENCDFHFPANSYRIKPEPKYRPFNSSKECWAEMQKHQPFGWVNYNGYRVNIAAVMRTSITLTNNKGLNFLFQHALEEFTFIDKQPFGVKEEE